MFSVGRYLCRHSNFLFFSPTVELTISLKDCTNLIPSLPNALKKKKNPHPKQKQRQNKTKTYLLHHQTWQKTAAASAGAGRSEAGRGRATGSTPAADLPGTPTSPPPLPRRPAAGGCQGGGGHGGSSSSAGSESATAGRPHSQTLGSLALCLLLPALLLLPLPACTRCGCTGVPSHGTPLALGCAPGGTEAERECGLLVKMFLFCWNASLNTQRRREI